MRSSDPDAINNKQQAPYLNTLMIYPQPHAQQQQLIQKHLQQKQQLMSQKDDGTSATLKSSAKGFFDSFRPRSKSDSMRRNSQKTSNHPLHPDRVISNT